jgi:hypothetical protein
LSNDDRFRWRKGDAPLLYGLNRLGDGREAGYVVIAEGESCTQTLWFSGIPAVGLPGAGLWREARDAPELDGIETIYVAIEPDKGGETVRAWLARSSLRDRARLLTLPSKDVSELYIRNPRAFPTVFSEALRTARPWSAVAREVAEAERREAWEVCKELALESSILSRFAEAAAASGVVGEKRALKLLYLVLTSRLLDRPVSLVVKGPSSAGKSFIVEMGLRFFPETAYYAVTAMSERALAYSDEPLSHRFLVLYEAARDEFFFRLSASLTAERRPAAVRNGGKDERRPSRPPDRTRGADRTDHHHNSRSTSPGERDAAAVSDRY